eukprot:scaffold154_cov129-Cylindrotheca_fusiformis.AAC.26
MEVENRNLYAITSIHFLHIATYRPQVHLPFSDQKDTVNMMRIGLAYLMTATAARLIVPSVGLTTSRIASSRPTVRPAMTNLWQSTRSSLLHMSSTADTPTNKKSSKVPITLLSGFLGAGKTCTLQHLLENTEGVKIGVVVNDVANVNIDAKLVSGKKNGVVELQNGCACCSLADELLTSISTLLGDKRQFDALVVELSGVADPIAIKSNWNNAKLQGHPVTSKADISQIVTLVDASTFGTDWMSWDLAADRDDWVEPGDDCAGMRKVPELLAEQVEAANVILINKKDLAGPEQVKIASELARSMNKDADMEEVEYGRVRPITILRQLPKEVEDASACDDPDCTDASHSHSHSHDHSEPCADADCTDSSHSHNHEHSASCDDPDCTDPSHTHDHTHSSTATDQLGIVNFVYKADRPFYTKKLLTLLNQWPVPIKDDLDISLLKEAQEGGYELEGEQVVASPFVGVLRSKGFCWFAPTRWSGNNEDVWRHDTTMYWSHAGKHFGISAAGRWWDTISKDQMKQYFKDDMAEYERILKEDFVTEEFGDRRQEIVFIGVGLDEEEITSCLDDCLVKEKGMKRYRQELANYKNSILTAPVSSGGLFDVGGYDNMDL